MEYLRFLRLLLLVSTGGNKYKIFQDHVSYNLRKYFFSNTVIQTWNSLPDSIVASSTINSLAMVTPKSYPYP